MPRLHSQSGADSQLVLPDQSVEGLRWSHYGLVLPPLSKSSEKILVMKVVDVDTAARRYMPNSPQRQHWIGPDCRPRPLPLSAGTCDAL